MPIIPRKPDFLSDEEYSWLIRRDNHRCALRDVCEAQGKLGQSDSCSATLDFDHAHPKELGGDNSFANIRLLCSGPNRGRGPAPLKKWVDRNYWDRDFDHRRLRAIQALAAYEPIISEFLLGFPAKYRNELLKTITLMIGATGIGKTLLLLSALFAINKSVNSQGPAFPRVRSVLYLATDTTLREQTAKEIEYELTHYGMVNARPVVYQAKSFTDFGRGPNGADVVVSCPHSLWKVDGDKEGVSRRSDDEVRTALLEFDTIVFDEVDWASDQVQHICRIANHAIKFSLTASPPIMAGTDPATKEAFLKRFVQIEETAVADYRRAVKMDGCLKALPYPLFVSAGTHDGAEKIKRGTRHEIDGKIADADHAVCRSAILEAIVNADRLEVEMKQVDPENYYSPHIIVRLETKNEIKALRKTLPDTIDQLRKSGRIVGEGWDVSAIYDGHHNDSSTTSDEISLSFKDKNEQYRHPFMRAKNDGGKALPDKGCKRILLMANIGVRGINNWPAQAVVDCTRTTSRTENTQIVGRLIRWPTHLANWHNNPEKYKKFLTLRVYIPEPLMSEEKMASYESVYNYVQDMEEQVSGAGFLTWSDLAEGKSADSSNPDISVTAKPLTKVDKLKIMNGLGAKIRQNGGIPPEDLDDVIDVIVQTIDPPPSGKRLDRARDYGKRLVIDTAFRKAECLGQDKNGVSIDNVVDCTTRLKPKIEYTPDELIRYIDNHPIFSKYRNEHIDRIESGDQCVIRLISNELRREQEALYREPAKTFCLTDRKGNNGVLTEIMRMLKKRLNDSDIFVDDIDKKIPQAVYLAARNLFGVDKADNGGPLDQHAYHVAIMGRYQEKLMEMSVHILSRDQTGIYNIYALGTYDDTDDRESVEVDWGCRDAG